MIFEKLYYKYKQIELSIFAITVDCQKIPNVNLILSICQLNVYLTICTYQITLKNVIEF
jgi:hypothetical protein